MDIITITPYVLLIVPLLLSLIVFLYLFQKARRKKIKEFFSTPSILISGCVKSGKTQLLRMMAHNSAAAYPFLDHVMVNYMQLKDKAVRLLEVPITDEKKIEELKKLNLIGIIHLFDVSNEAEEINEQFKLYEKIRELGKKMIVVANKSDDIDTKKMKDLKKRIPKVILTSAFDGKGIYELRKKVLSEFLG
jgi:GTP1/Obg family GTP-binding protein